MWLRFGLDKEKFNYGGHRMKTIFERTHFDKNKQPKTFRVSYNEPEYNSRIKEGSFVISIMSKGNPQGYLLSTYDKAD